MEYQILTQKQITNKLQNEISNLFKQLNADIKQLSLNEVCKSNSTTIAYCKIDNKTVGIALMANYKVISGKKGWIEDVVVDSDYRGKGIGRKLIEFLIDNAKNNNFSEIMLFTGYEKKAAISLYEKKGFKLKNSHLYKLIL